MMMRLKRLRAGCACAALVLTMAPRAEAQGSLDTARGLYAAAEYSDALAMLDGLLTGSGASADRQSIELYRTLCLVAVGRKADAERAIEKILAQDPLYRPSGEDVPPRLRLAFTEARKRMLPSLIQQRYIEAKAAFDRQDFSAAGSGFGEVVKALNDPDIAEASARSPLSDLRMLAAGFHDLTSKAMAPMPASTVMATAPATVAPPASRMRLEPRIYGVEDGGVRPPVVIRQVIPPFPGNVTGWGSGVIEVIIDEAGA